MAQERIFLDEQVRFSGKVAIYNELNALRVIRGFLSTHRLQRALRLVLNKHKILRTSLFLNNDNGALKQCITLDHQTFTLAAEQTFDNENELNDIIYQTITNPVLFDLSNGRVFHCQVLRKQNVGDDDTDKQVITNSDVLIIAFHHAASDRSSAQIFLDDLCNAYNNNTTLLIDEQSLQYIDFAVHERLIDMTPSREFWSSQLEGYNLDIIHCYCQFDRHRSSSSQRSDFLLCSSNFF